MRIQDYDSVCDVTTPADIERALSKRHTGHNEFWLSDGTKLHPAMSILVNGDLACIDYFPTEGHPGFVSVGSPPSDGPNDVVFFVSPTEKIWIDSGAVVPFSDALKAAQEFSVSTAMPKCIDWESLVAGE
jgi:Immunity protein Imm1